MVNGFDYIEVTIDGQSESSKNISKKGRLDFSCANSKLRENEH